MTTTTSTPTLAEQIAFMRKRCASQEAHVAAGFDGGDNIPELERRRAILASLERLAAEQEFHNIDDVVKIRELESHIARLAVERDELMREEKKSHSQIDGLMKRLLRDEQDARRYRWIIDRPHIGIAMCWILPRDSVADTRVDYEAAIDSAMASQGGGDG